MQTFPRSAIVDTGPLFDFLLWQLSESRRIPNLLPRLTYLNRDHYRRSVRWYFGVARPLVTCPQVIAEIHRLAQEVLRGPRLGDFRRFAQHELTTLRLSEQLVELITMDADLLSQLGPTDTAILQIGDSSRSSRRPVFTEDGELAMRCRRMQVGVLRVADVLTIWQQYGTS